MKKRLGLFLLALTLGLAPAALAADAPLVKGCCQRPLENPPRAPQKRALCSGNMWSLASPNSVNVRRNCTVPWATVSSSVARTIVSTNNACALSAWTMPLACNWVA